MKLEAVFWDYPCFLDQAYLDTFLRENKGTEMYHWMMARMLERARVVDALHFFSIEEISERLPSLKLSPYATKKWNRLVEVYAPASRG
jgi:hypothetical protein